MGALLQRQFTLANSVIGLTGSSNLTKYTEQGPSCEANSFSTSQEIPFILRKTKDHYGFHKACHQYLSSAKKFQSTTAIKFPVYPF
jgi:hypothetical protein